MNIFLLQLSILAQGDGLEGLINIVIVVFLAVSWIIGGIVKARSEQSRAQKSKKSPPKPPQRPSFLNRESAESILEKFLGFDISDQLPKRQQHPDIHSERKKVQYSRPVKERVSAESKPVKSPAYQNIKSPKGQIFSFPQTIQEPSLKEISPNIATLQDLTDYSTNVAEKPQSIHTVTSKEVPVLQSMLDFSDPDSLKSAILYYEILGKPLSLRDD